MDSETVPAVIKRPLPNAVTYDLSTAGCVKITLPESSTWSSGLHWHESHTEYLKLIRGTIRVRLGNTTRCITATDDDQPEIRVARYEWHEWQRATPDGPEVVVIERTEPSDNDKAVFFWNLNGVILNAPKLSSDPSSFVARCPSSMQGVLIDCWVTLNLFVIFRNLDNVPVFLNAPDFLKSFDGVAQGLLEYVDRVVSHVILFAASWVGWILGVKPVQRRYTPADAYVTWWSGRNGFGKKIS
ncbi:hypothetical protein EDB81DRAFT_700333 [Dactylonectria macrodidyma]|uniref:Uncharacterized protein n=1 Tax=Dactylonectria macrodidyma TaxID=307937 RepID=A0A9P9DM93_9HYPO|nr:hypothetical protein EDB81DRAFT_700333 [Dactylonectria macrodidyma]